VQVLGDSAYGTGKLLAAAAEAVHTAIIKPWPLRPAVAGGFTLDECTVGARRTSMVYQHHRWEGSAGVAAGPARRLDTRGRVAGVGRGTLTTRGGGRVRSGLGGAGSSSWWRRRRTRRAPGVRRHRQ